MRITPEEIEHYARRHSTPESAVLKKLNRETQAKILRPRMLSGHLQGRLLEMISRMIKPKRILEIGTYTGYSAICMAQGMQPSGILHTIDNNPELEDFTRSFFKEAGLDKKIMLHIGEALEVIPTLDEVFDLVFIDADKENYINYFNMAFEKLKKGGIIIADNVLWSGKVLKPADIKDKDTLGIQAFNEYVSSHQEVISLLLPFRDGLMVLQKI